MGSKKTVFHLAQLLHNLQGNVFSPATARFGGSWIEQSHFQVERLASLWYRAPSLLPKTTTIDAKNEGVWYFLADLPHRIRGGGVVDPAGSRACPFRENTNEVAVGQELFDLRERVAALIQATTTNNVNAFAKIARGPQ